MQDRLQHALDLCNKNKFDEALPILEEITKDAPQNSEAWRTLAQLHWFHQHEPEKAYDSMMVIPSGIVVFLQPAIRFPVVVLIIALQLSRES